MSYNRKTINPDGIERTRTSSSLLDRIFKATLGLDPNLNLSPIKLKELFIIVMCMTAEYFFENPLEFLEYGFFRVYKPDGKGKFLLWEVTEEKLFWHPEEATKMALGEGNLVEEFKKQLIEFIQSVTRISMGSEAPIKDMITRLQGRKNDLLYNKSDSRKEQERIRNRKRYLKEREYRLSQARKKRAEKRALRELEKQKELEMRKELEEKEKQNGD